MKTLGDSTAIHRTSYLLIHYMALDLVIVHKTKLFPSVLISEKDHEKDH